jgi:hypothetical protein
MRRDAMRCSLRLGRLGSARLCSVLLCSAQRQHRFVYCCVIAGACFDVTVLAWRKYTTIYLYIRYSNNIQSVQLRKHQQGATLNLHSQHISFHDNVRQPQRGLETTTISYYTLVYIYIYTTRQQAKNNKKPPRPFSTSTHISRRFHVTKHRTQPEFNTTNIYANLYANCISTSPFYNFNISFLRFILIFQSQYNDLYTKLYIYT